MQGALYFVDRINAKTTEQPLPGQYLLRPIHQDAVHVTIPGSDCHAVRFFAGTKREVTLLYVPLPGGADWDIPESLKAAFRCAERLASLAGDAPESAGKFLWSNMAFERLLTVASQFLRGAKTLVEDCYRPVGGLSVAADGGGLAVHCPETDIGARPARALVMHMLGLACHRVLENAIAEFAGLSRRRERGALERMHEDISHFLAASYFDMPARAFTLEVGQIYGLIRERLLLRELSRELVEQLERVSEASRVQRQAQEAAFESRTQRRFTLIGIAVAVMGLIQVAQITPAQVGVFFRTWTDCLIREGVCFSRPPPVAQDTPAARPGQPARRATGS